MNSKEKHTDLLNYPKLSDWVNGLSPETQSVFTSLFKRLSDNKRNSIEAMYEKIVNARSEIVTLSERLVSCNSSLKNTKSTDYSIREKELVAKRLRQLLEWSE